MKKRKEGFTLIELLIVMAVIAALMGALVPVAINAINHANATRVAENLRAISTAAQQYIYTEKSTSVTIDKLSPYLAGKANYSSDYGVTASKVTANEYVIKVWYKKTSPSTTAVKNVWSAVTTLSTNNKKYPSVDSTISIYW